MKLLSVSILGLLGVVACTSTGSSALATDQMRPTFTVTVDSRESKPTTTFVAKLEPASERGGVVRLEQGDALSVATDAETIALPFDGIALYPASRDGIAGRTFARFVLTRKTPATELASQVSVPAAMALEAPAALENVAYGGGAGSFTLRWSNAIDGANVVVVPTSCNTDEATATSLSTKGTDRGALDVSVSNLLLEPPPKTGACVRLKITRSFTTAPAAGFAPGGAVTAERLDYRKIMIVP